MPPSRPELASERAHGRERTPRAEEADALLDGVALLAKVLEDALHLLVLARAVVFLAIVSY
jgi:hypothetical protein